MWFTYKRDKKMKLRKNETLEGKSQTREKTTLTTWTKRERERKKKVQYEFYTMTLFDYNLQKQIYTRRQKGIDCRHC